MQPFVRDLGESRGVELALYAESIIERKRHHISEMRDVTGPSRHVSCFRGEGEFPKLRKSQTATCSNTQNPLLAVSLLCISR